MVLKILLRGITLTDDLFGLLTMQVDRWDGIGPLARATDCTHLPYCPYWQSDCMSGVQSPFSYSIYIVNPNKI